MLMAENRKAKSENGDPWYNCYAGGRGDLFLPESNRHPAKMAVALCYRIFEHGRQMAYWQPGDTILDPMAGIFTTGIVGASLGYKVAGVELETHFVELARKNIELLMAKLPDVPRPVLMQGDARRLRELLAGADGAVTSPPYSSEFREQHPGTKGGKVAEEFERGGSFRGYSGAVSSPPYLAAPSGGGINIKGYGADGADKVGERTCSDRTVSGAITSPPYAGHPGHQDTCDEEGNSRLAIEKKQLARYSGAGNAA